METAGATTEPWREPARGGYPDPRLIGLPGRERLGVWSRGKAPPPPLFHLTGARPTGFGDGTAEAEMPISGWLLNSAGLVSGGTLAIVADIAFGCSIETRLAAGIPYTTAELSLTFLRPARPGTVADVGGQAIHVGRSVALSEAFLLDRETETMIAHGTSRCAVLPPLDPVPEAPAELADFDDPGRGDSDPYRRPPPAEAVLPQGIWTELSGAEILDRQLRGQLSPPPIHFLSGLRLTDWGEGEATMALPATEWLVSPTRLLQGGTIAMLADNAMLAAVQTTTAPGVAFAGLDLKVNYLRPAPPDGRDLVARAQVAHAGRTIAVCRARVENADGKAVALATGSAIFLPGAFAQLGDAELAAPDVSAQ